MPTQEENEAAAAALLLHVKGVFQSAGALGLDLHAPEVEALLFALAPKLTLALVKARVVRFPRASADLALDTSRPVSVPEAIQDVQLVIENYRAQVQPPG